MGIDFCLPVASNLQDSRRSEQSEPIIERMAKVELLSEYKLTHSRANRSVASMGSETSIIRLLPEAVGQELCEFLGCLVYGAQYAQHTYFFI